MAFQSVDRIIHSLKRQPEWQEWREFEQLLNSWTTVVGFVVSKHTRPLYVRDRVLQVATSTSVWAQQLTFERSRILQKLNPRLDRPLKDIRFSSSRWHSIPKPTSRIAPSTTPKSLKKPSPPQNVESTADSEGESTDSQDTVQTPQEVFERWAQKIRARSRGLPLCPECNCPTPPVELQRWSMCAPCRAKKAQQPWGTSQTEGDG